MRTAHDGKCTGIWGKKKLYCKTGKPWTYKINLMQATGACISSWKIRGGREGTLLDRDYTLDGVTNVISTCQWIWFRSLKTDLFMTTYYRRITLKVIMTFKCKVRYLRVILSMFCSSGRIPLVASYRPLTKSVIQ